MLNVHPDHAMKVYRMKEGEAPLYSEPWRQMTVGDRYHAPAALQPAKNCGTHWMGGWVPKPDWTFWRREKSRTPARAHILAAASFARATWSSGFVHFG